MLRAEKECMEARIAELLPLQSELETWQAEVKLLKEQIANWKAKEQEIQRGSFEELVVSFLKHLKFERELGALGPARLLEARLLPMPQQQTRSATSASASSAVTSSASTAAATTSTPSQSLSNGTTRETPAQIGSPVVTLLFAETSKTPQGAASLALGLQEEICLMKYFGKAKNVQALRALTVSPDPFSMSVEACPGGDLETALREELRGSVSMQQQAVHQQQWQALQTWPVRLRVAQDVAEAVYGCHTMIPPQVYGNLRADTVLLCQDPRSPLDVSQPLAKLSLLDFCGLTRLAHALQRPPRRCGAYTAPELLANGDTALSPAADVFSFGLLMWQLTAPHSRRLLDELLTLAVSSSASTSATSAAGSTPELIAARALAEGIRPRIAEDMPAEVRELMEWCWQSEPMARPSMPLVLERLTALLERLAPRPPSQIFGRFIWRSTQLPSEVTCLTLAEQQVWAGCRGGQLVVFSRESGTQMGMFVGAHQGPVRTLLYQGDGRVWSGGADGRVVVWYIPARESQRAGLLNRRTKGGLGRSVWKASWCVVKPSGELTFYRTSADPEPRRVVSLQDAQLAPLEPREAPGQAENVFQLTERGGQGPVHLLQARTAQERREWMQAIEAQIARLRNPQAAQIRQLQEIDLLLQLQQHSPDPQEGPVGAVQVTFLKRDLERMLVSLSDSRLVVLESRSARLLSIHAILGEGDRRVSLGPMAQCGSYLCIAADQAVVRLSRETYAQRGLLTGHRGEVVALLGIGRELWSASVDGTIRVWNADTQSCLAVLEAHAGPASSLLLAGNAVWSSGRDPGLIRIWDTRAHFLIKDLEVRHSDQVSALLYAGDNCVWSASYDHTICIWTFPPPTR